MILYLYFLACRVDICIGQVGTERSFELDILLKNYRMKQKKIDKDQRNLPLTAIAIDSKLWGF